MSEKVKTFIGALCAILLVISLVAVSYYALSGRNKDVKPSANTRLAIPTPPQVPPDSLGYTSMFYMTKEGKRIEVMRISFDVNAQKLKVTINSELSPADARGFVEAMRNAGKRKVSDNK